MSYITQSVDYRSGHLQGGGVEYTKLNTGSYEVVASGGANAHLVITDIVAGGSASAMLFKTSSNLDTGDDDGELIAFVPASKSVHYPFVSPIRLPKGDTLHCDGDAGAMVVVHYHIDGN